MKKIFLLSVTFLCIASGSYAQKRTWIVELEGDYDRQAYTKNGFGPTQYLESSLLSAAGGYQFTQHFTAGLAIGVSSAQYFVAVPIIPTPLYGNTLENAKHSRNTLSLGVWYRYTHWLNQRFYIYSQVNTSIEYSDDHELAGKYYYYTPLTATTLGPAPNMPLSGFTITAFPAIGMNIIHGFGLHLDVGGIQYSTATIADGYGDYNRLRITLGHQFHFGLHKIIGWKKMNSTPNDPNTMLK